jgi:hypothetical protein
MSSFDGRVHLLSATTLDDGDHFSGCGILDGESIVFVISRPAVSGWFINRCNAHVLAPFG